MKVYQFPSPLSQWIDIQLKTLGFGLHKQQLLAKSILQVSNDYQEISAITHWHDNATLAAYLTYFFPLNYIRSQRVIDEGKRWNFFEGLQTAVDFGCGPGTTSKALLFDPDIPIPRFHGIDSFAPLEKWYTDNHGFKAALSFSAEIPKIPKQGSLLLASYVINELRETPKWFFDFERVMIIEPSTKQAFPKLLDLRDQLLQKGYDIVAPCPHHHTCPLQDSKRDWCHDRLHWQAPDWFQRIESHLPIKNNTLTHSYLLASKTSVTRPDFARVVGDPLPEKGKTRWMLCQGPERQFLRFLKRQGRAPEIARGDRVQLDHFETNGNEIRFELKDFKKI